MALRKSSQVFWFDIYNTPRVYDALWYQAGIHEQAQPFGCDWIKLVVIIHA
jgi:hypothetical protein